MVTWISLIYKVCNKNTLIKDSDGGRVDEER